MSVSIASLLVSVVLAAPTFHIVSGEYRRIYRETGMAAGDQLGARGTAGDWDGDGHLDLAVAAWQAAEHAGVIHVVYATPGFPDSSRTALIPGTNRGNFAGFALFGGGDVNGDRIDDLLIGCHLRPAPSIVQVHFGSPAGLSDTPDLVLYGDLPRDYFGYSVAAFDANRDGWDDIVVGADDDGEKWEGSVWVFYGGPLLDDVADELIPGHWKVTANLGSNLAVVGDPDLLVGDHDIRRQWTNGLGRAFLCEGSDGGGLALEVMLPGPQADAHYSWSMTGMADWDGDGFDDFAIGAPRYDRERGTLQQRTAAVRVVVHHGSEPIRARAVGRGGG